MSEQKAEVRIVPYEPAHLEPILALMRKWSPDHPELAERSLYEWQRCTRYVAMAGNRVVGQICQITHEFRNPAQPPTPLGWGITLVLDMSDDNIRKAAGRQLLAACENAPGLHYAAVGVVPTIEPAYVRRGHQLRRDDCSYFARFFQPAKALAYWKKGTWLAPALHAANLVYRPNTAVRHGTTTRITQFDAAWDATWDRLLQARYQLAGVRTADYLNYKLAQPRRAYHAHVHRNAAGDLDGYIVYRRAKHLTRDLDLVRICDFVGTDAALDDLFTLATAFAQAERTTGTYGIVGLSANVDRAVFRRAGLWVQRPYPVVLAAPVQGSVRVSFFDSDLDDLW